MKQQDQENQRQHMEESSEGAPRVEIVKGNLCDAQKAALEQVVDSIAEAVERERNAKPDSRGHFGTPTIHWANNTANPAGFRTAPLPRR
ncbi:hypothetical protein [Corynebacterium anserum]|uniref:hypothetical protein n=1 Tax=Corynebacterium anserum TaxID=2684406 RepID=UPI00163AAB9C|nr:hypothetical protein [Corynebacterium anserum]